MNQRHYLLKGTFYLTAAGVFSRIAGFFYKIFLSRTIGAEEIGLYHLTFPVYGFCMAAAAGGIQTAISRFTAEYSADNDRKSARRVLLCGLSFSLCAAALCTALLFLNASAVARVFLFEPRCTVLLQITALSIPFSTVHSCVMGYFIGRKNVAIPAVSQVVEQLFRIASVFLFYTLFCRRNMAPDASVMVLGELAGELSASLFSLSLLFFEKKRDVHSSSLGRVFSTHPCFAESRRLLSMSAPLALNRMLLCVLQSVEAALLPQQLRLFGLSGSESLARYGTLTGMAMPLLLFPTAVTGALGTLLLPLISEARALHQNEKISSLTAQSFRAGLLLGFLFFDAFLLLGSDIGALLFNSPAAGTFLRRLALLCPFLYVNTMLISILHGIGRTTAASVQSIAGFLIRLAFVLLLVPSHGMNGYFTGLLCSNAFVTLLTLLTLRRNNFFHPNFADSILKPSLLCITAGAILWLMRRLIPYLSRTEWVPLALCLLLCFALFAIPVLYELRRAHRS